MTKEQILATSLYEQLAQEREQHQQQLSAEREAHKKEIERILSAVARGENLADSLNFDGKSELQKERERAGKLVEALKDAFDEFEDLNLHRQAARIHETLNEYDTATKEPGSH